MTITNTGLNLVRNLLAGDSININNIAVGNSATAVTVSDTTLGSETLRKTTTATKETTTGLVTQSITVLSTDIPNQNVSEVGLLDATSGGNLYNRVVFASTLHATGQEMRIEIQTQVRRG